MTNEKHSPGRLVVLGVVLILIAVAMIFGEAGPPEPDSAASADSVDRAEEMLLEGCVP